MPVAAASSTSQRAPLTIPAGTVPSIARDTYVSSLERPLKKRKTGRGKGLHQDRVAPSR